MQLAKPVWQEYKTSLTAQKKLGFRKKTKLFHFQLLLLKKVDSKSANFVLEVNELRLAGLVVVGYTGLVEFNAHTLEVSHRSVKEVRLDTDVSALAGTSAAHKLKLVTRKYGL